MCTALRPPESAAVGFEEDIVDASLGAGLPWLPGARGTCRVGRVAAGERTAEARWRPGARGGGSHDRDRLAERGLERYSGGEQDLANFCLRLSIADWIARERGVEVGLLLLDEVFGSQDDERRHRLIDALSTLRHRFDQMLVITHAPDIAERCTHQIVVSLDGRGRSTAEITCR